MRLSPAIMVPLYGLGKMHPFCQVGAGCARNGWDYCDHSPPWPGALGQGKKKRPWLSKYRLPKNLSQKTKTKQKTQPKQQQKYPFSFSLVSSSFTKSCPSVSSSSTHTHTHILVKRRKVTPPVSRETSIRANTSLRLWTIKRDRAFLPSQYLQFPPTLHKAN